MKRYNTPHRHRVIKTRLTEEEYAEFAEYIEINTTDTAGRAAPRQSIKSFWQCVFLIKRNLM